MIMRNSVILIEHDDYVYEKFKKKLKRHDEGWYETGLVWKEENLPLGNSKKWEFTKT